MTFLAPIGLLALVALPIILWLHLLRERRPRAVVPSLLLWQNLPRKPEGQKRRRLPLTLLLLLHLLAALLLGLAIGQPQWLGNLLGRGTHTAVIIDTSTSMQATDSAFGGTRFDQARDRARSLINGLNDQNHLTLIAAGPQADFLGTGGLDSRANLIAALDDLVAGGTGTDVVGAVTLAQATLEGERGGRIVVISDAALPELPEAEVQQALQDAPITWEVVGSDLENRSLVIFAARARGGANAQGQTPFHVYARVANYSGGNVTTDLRLFGDDELLDTRQVNLPPEGEAEATWTVPAGVEVLRAEVDGRDDLPVDDVAYLSLGQTRSINTLLVSNTPGPIERVLAAIPGPEMITVTPEDYTVSPAAAEADLTIFDGTLPEAWPTGGVLVINPPPGPHPLLSVQETRTLTETAPIASLQVSAAADLLDGLSLDSVNFNTAQVVQPPEWAQIQLAANDVPLILRGQVDESNIAIWTFDLATSNVTERLAFPLLMARTVSDLTPAVLPTTMAVGETLTIQPSLRADTLELLVPDGENQQMAISTTVQLENLRQPGIYTVIERAANEMVYAGRFAVNAGSPREADLRARPLPTAGGDAETATAIDPTESREQEPLWPGLALAALIVLVIEWVYIHR